MGLDITIPADADKIIVPAQDSSVEADTSDETTTYICNAYISAFSLRSHVLSRFVQRLPDLSRAVRSWHRGRFASTTCFR